MLKKIIAGIMLTILLTTVGLVFEVQRTISSTTATRWSVGPHPEADFATIQEAINHENVSEGDLIEVRWKATPYNESVVVNKSLAIRHDSYDPSDLYPTVSGAFPDRAVFNVTASNVEIDGFIIQDGYYGILASNKSTVIANNTVVSNGDGVLLLNQSATVLNNNITSNGYGILLAQAYDNTIFNNTITMNGYGIRLYQAYNNTLKENRMIGNTLNFGVGGTEVNDFIQDIDVSNTVDEKPIYYWMNQHDMTIPSDAGYVGIVNCVNITVEGLNMTQNGEGVLVVNTTHVTIRDVNIASNGDGVSIVNSIRIMIKNANIVSNWYGIWGRMMGDSNITNVEVSDNDWGISLSNSSHNIISNNLMVDNGRYDGATAVIDLRFSSYNVILDNELTSHYDYTDIGVKLSNSSNNIIVGNNIKTLYVGIGLESSNGNILYHNNIINNYWEQVFIHMSPDNNWDNGHEGNYWSNYPYEDADGDGIGDKPHRVYSTVYDNFPLMMPWSAWKAFEPPMSFYVETPDQKLSTFSNSTLASLCLSRKLHQISLKATSGYSGFLNITIPRRWLDGPFKVEVDEVEVGYVYTPPNANYSSLYITFDKGSHTITINGTQLGSILSDLDGDGDVDLYDAVALLLNYGKKEDNVPEPYYLEETTP